MAPPTSTKSFSNMDLTKRPDWNSMPDTRQPGPNEIMQTNMKELEACGTIEETKDLMKGRPDILNSCMLAVSLEDERFQYHKEWVLSHFYDFLREDASMYSIFEEAFKANVSVMKPLMSVLEHPDVDKTVEEQVRIADKAAWLLTAVMGNASQFFSDDDVNRVLDVLVGSQPGTKKFLAGDWDQKPCPCSELGVLSALTNLLKASEFRNTIWSYGAATEVLFKVLPNDSPDELYKFTFAIWMLSFDGDITKGLRSYGVIKKFKDILSETRTEKVVRLSLTVFKAFLAHKELCEDMVEMGLLETVQQLEYEKWRDTDLYDEIREVSAQIASQVGEFSSFDRYNKELDSKTLKWGFIHSSKFWAENVMKFEKDDFKAAKKLGDLLRNSTDPETLAVACHDAGEFVALHPMGKKKLAPFIKDRVMDLMSKQDSDHREVRREALLCCQKIMLNKWQDMRN